DEDEHHLTGIHVAEQTQSQAQRLGQQTEDFEEQVERYQRPVIERGERQFLGKAADTLDLEAIEENQDEHAKRQTKGTVRIGGRYDLEGWQAEQMRDTGDVIDRNPLQAVHQEHPDEDGQRQWGNQRVTAVEGVLDDAFDKLDAHFNEILQATRNTVGGDLGSATEDQDEQRAHQQRPAQCVQVESHEAHVPRLDARLGNGPCRLIDDRTICANVACRQFSVSQILQVMLNIFRRGTRHKRLSCSMLRIVFQQQECTCPSTQNQQVAGKQSNWLKRLHSHEHQRK